VAKEQKISDEEIGAVLSIVMSCAAGRVKNHVRESLEKK
jgi:hypothetical protein